MPVEESGSIKSFSADELEAISQKAQGFEEVGKILKSKQSEINKISKQVNRDQKDILKQVASLKKQQVAEQKKIEKELKKIEKETKKTARENKRKGGIYADDIDIPTLPKSKDTKDFMKFRKEIMPDATWEDWLVSQGRTKKAANPKRASGDSKIRPTIEDPGILDSLMMSLGIKKFERKAAKGSLISAGGRPSQEGDNEFYAVRRRIEALEGGQKGIASFIVKTNNLLGGAASGAGGMQSNIADLLKTPQGMANLAQSTFGNVAGAITTLGNPETIKTASKAMGGLARSASSTLGIGDAAGIGAGVQGKINGIMGRITAVSSKVPVAGMIVTAAIAVTMLVVNAHLDQFKAGGTKDVRKRQLAQDQSLLGVESDNMLFSGSTLFFSNPSRTQGLPPGRSNTEGLIHGMSRYNLRNQGSI